MTRKRTATSPAGTLISHLRRLRRGHRDAVAEPRLQLAQLLLHASLGLHLGEVVLQRLAAPDVVRLDLALRLVQRALHLLEAGEGVGDALVVQLAAELDA